MVKQKKSSMGLLLCILMIACATPVTAFASPYGSLSARAVIPENQVDRSLTYFDLRLSPGEAQTIQVLLRNGGDEAINAYLEVNQSTTGRNGIILYDRTDSLDSSLSLPIGDVAVPVDTQVVVPPKGEAYADIRLEMPEADFDGCILGGIQVKAEPLTDTPAELVKDSNLQLTNEYVYTIGLKITQNDAAIKPDMHLKSVEPELINYRPGIAVNLQNSEAAIIKGMHITGHLSHEENADTVKSIDLTNVDVAPQSNFDTVFDWSNQPLQPGNYRLRMKAVYQDQVWEWDEGLHIPSNTADEINTESMTLPRQPVWLYALLVILAIAFVITLVMLYRKRRRADPE